MPTVAEIFAQLKKEGNLPINKMPRGDSPAETMFAELRKAVLSDAKKVASEMKSGPDDEDEEDDPEFNDDDAEEESPKPDPDSGVDPAKLPKKVKVECQKCDFCGEKTKKDVQGKEWTDEGKAEHDPNMHKLKGDDGKTRFCPDYSLVRGKPIKEEDLEEEKEPEPVDTSWVVDKGYGPKCKSCGAGRGEDHCSTCPHKDKCTVDEALSMATSKVDLSGVKTGRWSSSPRRHLGR